MVGGFVFLQRRDDSKQNAQGNGDKQRKQVQLQRQRDLVHDDIEHRAAGIGGDGFAEIQGEEVLQPEEILFSPDGGVGAIVSLQSPFDSDRTVVALLSEGQAGSYLLNEQLKSPSSMATVSGSVVIINEQSMSDFKVGDSYTIGDLPWYHKIWQTMSNYPLLLVLCALVCAVLVGTGIFYFMRLWVRGRAR